MKTRYLITMAAGVVLASCGGDAQKPAAEATPTAPVALKVAKPVDETRRFPMDGREKVDVVEDHLLGMDFLPGGNIAEYKKDGKAWKQFVIKADNPGQTAILLGRIKDALKDPKFVAHMGGYYGMHGDTPVFAFPKGRWIAGVTGLPEKDADTLGRQMALRLD